MTIELLSKQLAETKQAEQDAVSQIEATEDLEQAGRLGGLALAFREKARVIAAKLSNAEAAERRRQREAEAAALQAKKDAMHAEAAELADSWQAWITDMEQANAAVGRLWQRYEAMTSQKTALHNAAHSMGFEVNTGGESLSETLRQCRDGGGYLRWLPRRHHPGNRGY